MDQQRSSGFGIFEASDAATNRLEEVSEALPSRREFLAGTLAVSTLACAGVVPPAEAQPSGPGLGDDRLKIGEIASKDGKLTGVLTIRNEKRKMPADAGVPE